MLVSFIKCIVIMLINVTSVSLASQRGYFIVEFFNYENPGGLKINGKPCDQKPIISPCDTFFDITFRLGGKILVSVRTPTIPNSNSVDFGQEAPDPFLQMNFSKLHGPLEYRIEVWDNDGNKADDMIETLTGNLTFNATSKWQRINVTNPGRRSFLVFKAMVECYSKNDSCILDNLSGRKDKKEKDLSTSTSSDGNPDSPIFTSRSSAETKPDSWIKTSTMSTEKRNFYTWSPSNKASTTAKTACSGKLFFKFSIIVVAVALIAFLILLFSLFVFNFMMLRKSTSRTIAQNIQMSSIANNVRIRNRYNGLIRAENPVYLESTVTRIIEEAETSLIDNVNISHAYMELENPEEASNLKLPIVCLEVEMPSTGEKGAYRSVEGSDDCPNDDVDSHVYAEPSMEKKRLYITRTDLKPQAELFEDEQTDVTSEMERRKE